MKITNVVFKPNLKDVYVVIISYMVVFYQQNKGEIPQRCHILDLIYLTLPETKWFEQNFKHYKEN